MIASGSGDVRLLYTFSYQSSLEQVTCWNQDSFDLGAPPDGGGPHCAWITAWTKRADVLRIGWPMVNGVEQAIYPLGAPLGRARATVNGKGWIHVAGYQPLQANPNEYKVRYLALSPWYQRRRREKSGSDRAGDHSPSLSSTERT